MTTGCSGSRRRCRGWARSTPSNRVRVQADTAHAAPYSLDGSGVTVFVYDGGTVRASHNDYSGRATLIDGDSTSFHATHVAGTVGGDGSANFNHRGMAPGVSILSAGFEYDGSGTFLYTNPGDIEFDYTNAINQGASISNNSIGSNIAPNGFPCSYEGDYGLTAATIDAVVGGSLGEPIVIFWAAGNERGNGSVRHAVQHDAAPVEQQERDLRGCTQLQRRLGDEFHELGPVG
jgi:hypothetical protein